MKRMGRNGRVLGRISEEDALDDEMIKQLLEAADIPADVLLEMPDEEKKGTLKAILESNPFLLEHYKKLRFEAAQAGITGSTSLKVQQETQKSKNPVKEEVIFYTVSEESSNGGSRDSTDIVQDNPESTQAKLGQMVNSTRNQPSVSCSNSDPVVLASDEEETQRPDLGDSVLATDTVMSWMNIEQGMSEDTVPETPDEELNSEDERATQADDRTTQDDEKMENVDQELPYFRLQPSEQSDDDGQLSGIYRKHLKELQEKSTTENETKPWPSFWAPHNISNPNLYTQVVKLMLDIYSQRVLRAQKQMTGNVAPWGKPVDAGSHVRDCLVDKKLGNKLFKNGEITGGSTRNKPQRNLGNKQTENDDSDDSDIHACQNIKRDQIGKKMVQNREVSYNLKMRNSHHPTRRSPNQDDAEQDNSGDDNMDDDEYLPPKCTKPASKQSESTSRKRAQVVQKIEHDSKRKRMSCKTTVDDDLNVGKKSLSLNKNVQQIRELKKRTKTKSKQENGDVKGEDSSTKEKYVWSDDETQVSSTAVDAVAGRRGSVDSRAQDDDVIALQWKNQKHVGSACAGGASSDGCKHMSRVDSVNRNKSAAVTDDDVICTGVSSSQSSESLLDAQGNLYSTQMPLAAQNTSLDSIHQDERSRNTDHDRDGQSRMFTTLERNLNRDTKTMKRSNLDAKMNLAVCSQSKRRKTGDLAGSRSDSVARVMGDVSLVHEVCMEMHDGHSNTNCLSLLGQTLAPNSPKRTCPICGQDFPLTQLEAHASTCGEDGFSVSEINTNGRIKCSRCDKLIPQAAFQHHQRLCLQDDTPSRRVTRSSK